MTAPHILGVIPARGGSKGVPRKNLAPLDGRPLIAYTCDAARASRRLTRTVASTDDPEIAAVATALGIEVPALRPAALAGDATPMTDVILHVLGELLGREQYRPDVVVVLQPTSPFRRAEHIDAAVELLLGSQADAVVTVVPVPHQFTPASLMRLDGDRLALAVEGGGPLRRQEKPALFARNGPAVVAVRAGALLEQRALYGRDTRGLVMSRADSLDVDDAFDLEVAELLMAARARARRAAVASELGVTGAPGQAR